MKKEVCIDVRMAANSGIGTYIRSLVPRMRQAEHNFRLVANEDCLKKFPELSSFDIILTKSPLFSIQEQISLPFLIPRCDLFWSPHFNIPLGPIKSRKRLVTIHDVYFLAYPRELVFYKQAYARVFFSAAVKRSDHVITESDFSFQEILKYIGPYAYKMTNIPLGVDATKFRGIEAGLNVKIPESYILFVGNLSPSKNICNLVKSLDFLPEEIHLVLAGREGKWDGWKKEVASRSSRVSILGKVDHAMLAQLYRNARLLAHVSRYEGFGLTPLEAMSVECPTVVSNVASLPEVCGDASVYVNPEDPADIAKGIYAVWSDSVLQNTLRAKGLKRVEIFNWDTSAQKHLEVIERLL